LHRAKVALCNCLSEKEIFSEMNDQVHFAKLERNTRPTINQISGGKPALRQMASTGLVVPE